MPVAFCLPPAKLTHVYLIDDTMSKDLNKVQLIGRLTRDVDVRQTPSGQSVVTITIVTNHGWTDGGGTRQEKAEFTDVVAWGKLAEIMGQYCRKGSRIYIEGRLQTRSWDTPDGQKKFRTEVIANEMILLDGRPTGAGDSSDNGGQTYSNEPMGDSGHVSIDEVPF